MGVPGLEVAFGNTRQSMLSNVCVRTAFCALLKLFLPSCSCRSNGTPDRCTLSEDVAAFAILKMALVV